MFSLKKTLFIIGAGGAVVIVVLFIVLIAMSFSVLSPTEMGIKYNSAEKKVDRSNLYTAGRHYLGPSQSFIIFPRVLETVNQGVTARTSDGLAIQFSLAFNYRINPDLDKVTLMYELFVEDYRVFLEKVSSNLIRDVAAEYGAFSYFFNRSTITVNMGRALSDALSQFGFSIEGFQLINFDLPMRFQKSMQDTQVAREQISQALFEQQAASVEAETRIAEANRTAQMKILEASASGVAVINSVTSQAAALQLSLGLEAMSYSALKQRLNMTTGAFVQWVWLDALDTSKAHQKIAVPTPTPL